MKKKLFAWFMTIIMVFSSLNIVAFADEENIKHYPNYSVDTCFSNDDCKLYDSKDLDIQFKITFSGESIMIPVIYDNEYEGYYVEGYSELLKKLIETESTDFTTEVIIEDNNPEHNFQNDNKVDLDITTKQEIVETLNALANLIIFFVYESVVEEGDTATLVEMEAAFGGTITLVDDVAMLNGVPVTFQDFVNAYKNNAEAMGLGEDELTAIQEYEDMMASDDFIGSADFTINLNCDCTEMFNYSVYHEYYDSKGELIDWEWDDLKAEADTVIKISDIPLVETYDGKTYEFEGAYLYDDEFELDLSNPITEFTLEEDYFEVGLKYVLVKSSDSNSITDDSTSTPNHNNDQTPETGDDFNTTPFMLLMILAGLGAVITISTRRRV